MTAVVQMASGHAGIGVVAPIASPNTISSIREQAAGTRDYLYFKAVLRALQLGKHMNARNVSVLCPDEKTVDIVTRKVPLELGSPLAPLYIKIRALVYTFANAEIMVVPITRVEPAARLALAAGKSQIGEVATQTSLFPAA